MSLAQCNLIHPKLLSFTPYSDAFFFAELAKRAMTERTARDKLAGIFEATIADRYGISDENGLPLREMICEIEGRDPNDTSYMTKFDEVKDGLGRLVADYRSDNGKRFVSLASRISDYALPRAHMLLREGIAHDLFEEDDSGYHPGRAEVNEAYGRDLPVVLRETKNLVDQVLTKST